VGGASIISLLSSFVFSVPPPRLPAEKFWGRSPSSRTKRGYLKAFWCEERGCEEAIKEETKATTRCLPFIDKESIS